MKTDPETNAKNTEADEAIGAIDTHVDLAREELKKGLAATASCTT